MAWWYGVEIQVTYQFYQFFNGINKIKEMITNGFRSVARHFCNDWLMKIVFFCGQDSSFQNPYLLNLLLQGHENQLLLRKKRKRKKILLTQFYFNVSDNNSSNAIVLCLKFLILHEIIERSGNYADHGECTSGQVL